MKVAAVLAVALAGCAPHLCGVPPLPPAIEECPVVPPPPKLPPAPRDPDTAKDYVDALRVHDALATEYAHICRGRLLDAVRHYHAIER